MKKVTYARLSLFSALLLISAPLLSQDFTWVKGTNLIGQGGIYGSVGIPAAANIPGARDGAVTWKDAAGNFWLFGGNGFDHIGNFGLLSDLWKYDVTSNQWTYIKGNDIIAQPTLYTNLGVTSPLGKPGGRSSSTAWADASGNLWLFGGYGYDGGTSLGYLNDLWKYNISLNEWTYVNGNSLCYQPGVYGTLGTASPSNTPGGRSGALPWADGTGNLWLFGGFGNSTASVTIGSLNDLWKYNITNNEWTWMKGSNIINQNGTYGTMGTAAPGNNPGGRTLSNGWVDPSGNFWLFGGDGLDASSTSTTGLLSDLWKYNITTNLWTWIKGNNIYNQTGIYGLQGGVNAANQPGGRSGATSWIDGVGNFWMFAGEGYPGSTSPAGGLNDLWKYDMTANNWTWIKGSSVIDQHGFYGTQGVSAFTNIPGARTTPASWIDASNNLWLFGGYGQAASGTGGDLNDLWKYTNCFISPITMTITSKDSVICAGESTSLTVTGSNNYLWINNLSTASYIVINPTANTGYSVYTSDNNGCKYMASFTETVLTCAGINKFNESAKRFMIYPNPSNGEFNLNLSGTEESTQFVIFNAMGQAVLEKTLLPGETLVKTNLARGIYHFQLRQSEKMIGSGNLLLE